MTTTFEPRHTPFPWTQHDDGGTLPGVYERSGGWRYGPGSADWVWGPRGVGYGLIADCSPYGQPCTTESIANAKLIAEIEHLVDLAEVVWGAKDVDIGLRLQAQNILLRIGRLGA
jgi:hypothetical protein